MTDPETTLPERVAIAGHVLAVGLLLWLIVATNQRAARVEAALERIEAQSKGIP